MSSSVPKARLETPASVPARFTLAARTRPARMPALPVKRPGASLPFILLFCCVVLSPHQLRAENSTAAFDAANQLYAEGKFVEAAAAYEKIVETGQTSSAIYFNLGNSWFKSGQIGRAIAAYRQAGTISPRDPDLRANLQFARNQVQGPTLRPGRWERWLGTLSLNEWTWLSAAAVWLTFALLTVRQLWPALARPLKSWTLAAGVITVFVIGCFAMSCAANSATSTAIVIVSEASVRNGPLEQAPNGFTARDGAELRVLDQKDDWLQVTDGTRRLGWVKRAAVLVIARSQTSGLR
jgi:tetratricopeptide (TPR) repeat protein